MVDDDEVRALRLAPRRHHMAAVVVGAALTEAVVARRGHLRPQRLRLGEPRHLGEVAGRGHLRPFLDAREQRVGRRDAVERALRDEPRHAVGAEVVAAALEQRDLHGIADRAGDERHILGVQLVLQGACPGRHQHPQPGEQRRHEIREGLAGAGARLDHQHRTFGEGLGHRGRHAPLGTAGREARQMPGERAASAQDVIDVLHGGRHATRLRRRCRAPNFP